MVNAFELWTLNNETLRVQILQPVREEIKVDLKEPRAQCQKQNFSVAKLCDAEIMQYD